MRSWRWLRIAFSLVALAAAGYVLRIIVILRRVRYPFVEPAADPPGVRHRFAQAGGVSWHYVEAGPADGEVVLLLHGLPESWWSWHHQIAALQGTYRTIAVDLKGYGQSSKADGNYAEGAVAGQLLALLDGLRIQRFHLVAHDWGTVVADALASRHPERIIRYVRMQAPLLRARLTQQPQFLLFKLQPLARLILGEPGFVPWVYRERTAVALDRPTISRIAGEFRRPGTARAVARYFRDFDLLARFDRDRRRAAYGRMRFPVLLLQGARDPAQPLWYFDGAAAVFPEARLEVIPGAGHFTELEAPEAVNAAILRFLRGA